MAEAYKYWAFISYSHQDRAWGDWLHKTLETYRVPKRLVGRASRDGQVPARLYPVFRDRDELPSSANLGDVLNESLRQSRYQIVICSPRSAASKWVNEEIKYFKSLGREDRVLCLIVDGEPNVFDIPGRDIEECFAPALRYRVDARGQITDQPAEPIAADAREHADGKRSARIKLLSGLLGVGFDELFQRERQRQFWQRVQMGLAAAAFAGLCVGAWQWYEGQRSAREREITIERLVENGRLDLLAGRQARAAVYFNEAYKMGHDTVPLRFMLAQAMKPVEALTDVRVEHGGAAVYKSAFSPDGSRFVLHVLTRATGDQRAVVRVYDAATGAVLAELPDSPVLPLTLEFLDGGARLLMTGFPDDNRLGDPFTRIWNLETTEIIVTLEGINGLAGRPLHPAGLRVLIAGSDGLAVHDARNAKRVARLLPGKSVTAASYSTDGQSIVAADSDGVVYLLKADSGEIVKTYSEARGLSLAAVFFTPNGQRLFAVTGRDGNRLLLGDVRIWDVERALLVLAFAAEHNVLNELQFDRSGARYLTVGSEGYKVWSTGRGILQFSIPRAMTMYSTAALSPDGMTLVTADFRNKVSEAWDIRSKRLLYSLDLHTDGISSAAFDHKGQRLLLSSRDGTAGIWRMPVMPEWHYESFDTLPYSAVFSGDGSRLLVAGGAPSLGHVDVHDLATRQVTHRFSGHQGVVFSARFSPDEQRIVTASLDGTAGLWDVPTGQRIAQMPHNEKGAYKAHFSQQGHRIVTTTYPEILGESDAVGLWNGNDGSHIAWLKHDDVVVPTAFDSDGTRVATAGFDSRVRIWDASNGRLLQTLTAFRGAVSSVSFSKDGRQLLTASYDSVVRIFDLESGSLVKSLADPSLGLTELAVFSPNGQRVAVSTQSGDVWLWHPTTGVTLTLKGHQQYAKNVRFSPDGNILLSDSDDGSVRAWDAISGAELGVVASFAGNVHSLDVDWSRHRLSASSWGQFSVSDIAAVARSATEIGDTLRCKAPWELGSDRQELIRVPRPPASRCAPQRQ